MHTQASLVTKYAGVFSTSDVWSHDKSVNLYSQLLCDFPVVNIAGVAACEVGSVKVVVSHETTWNDARSADLWRSR